MNTATQNQIENVNQIKTQENYARINKKALLNLLDHAKTVVDKRASMPILANVLLTFENDTAKIEATDLEQILIKVQKCPVVGSFKACAVHAQLVQIVKSRPNEIVKIESKAGEFLIDGIAVPTVEFFEFPADLKTYDSDKPGHEVDFAKVVESTVFCTSKDVTRYHLNGVYFEVKDKKLNAVATDGHRLGLIAEKTSIDEKWGFILPTKALKTIDRIFVNPKLTDNGQYVVVKSQLFDTTLIVRKIDGKYPNYCQFIPAKFEKTATFLKKDLLSLCAEVLPFVNKKSKGAVLFFDVEKLVMENSDLENGVIKRQVKAISTKGLESDLRIGLNLTYLIDALKALGAEKVDLKLNGVLDPIVVQAHRSEDHVNVLMPMRV